MDAVTSALPYDFSKFMALSTTIANFLFLLCADPIPAMVTGLFLWYNTNDEWPGL